MRYPEEIIDQVIGSNSIVDVISEYVKLTKKGSTYFGLCPFHNEKTPSFSVTDNGGKSMFYCFGCHAGGSAVTFLMKYEGCSYQEALKFLADRANITLPEPKYSKEEAEKNRLKEQVYEVNKLAALYFCHLLKTERGSHAHRYLTDRELSEDTIRSFGLGYSDKYSNDLYNYIRSKGYSDEVMKASGLFSIKEKGAYDYFWNRVMFPIMDVRSRVIAFGGRVMGDGEPKYLNSPETLIFEKNRTLFGLHAARKHKGKELILCEGYMDVISLHQAGFTNAVASLGTALTSGHVSVLKKYTDTVLISYDSDGAGRDAALRAIPKLKSMGMITKVVNLKPYKDPDELIKAEGSEEYTKRLRNARNSVLFEIDVLSENYDRRDPDQNTEFYNEVAKRLSYIDDEIERENYINTVCDEYGLDRKMLRDRVVRFALGRDKGTEYKPVPVRRYSGKKQEGSPADESRRMLLSYMAAYPGYYPAVRNHIGPSDFTTEPYASVAGMLFEQLDRGKVSIAVIIASFEEEQFQEKAAEIFADAHAGEDPEVIKKIINDCAANIRKSILDAQIDSETDIIRVLNLKKEREKLRDFRVIQ
ncbi:MAG: DNA primase [Parasporobacterium sp.]|nr:DNA primase [Parasporobacterium sp.]